MRSGPHDPEDYSKPELDPFLQFVAQMDMLHPDIRARMSTVAASKLAPSERIDLSTTG